MSYQVTFETGKNFVNATVTGTNSRTVILEYMTDILTECARQECFRVLIEERLDGPRLGAMDVFAVAAEGSLKALGQFEAIAYVDEKMGDMADFAETVAVNRGMPVAFFNDVENAEEWLSRQISGSAEQDIFLKRDKSDRT
jgi:hypothetical protein